MEENEKTIRQKGNQESFLGFALLQLDMPCTSAKQNNKGKKKTKDEAKKHGNNSAALQKKTASKKI